MINATKPTDVFLSYSLEDRKSAELVARAIENAGLTVFDPASLGPGSSVPDAIWEALAESAAVIVLLPKGGLTSANSAAELGAALAWQKPIYVVSNENGRTRVPGFLTGHRLYPMSRIEDVARSIKQGPDPLSEVDIETLRDLYLAEETPTDQLIKDPALLDLFAKRFNSKARSNVPPERLLYEMIRLRKKGEWPRLGRSRSKAKA